MNEADLNLIRQMRQVMAEWKRRGALVPSGTGLYFDPSMTGYAPRRLASYSYSVNSVGTTETDLATLSVPANTLIATGDILVGEYSGEFVGHATATRRIKAKFGGTTILDTGALSTASNDVWVLKVLIGRRSASIVTCAASLVSAVGTKTGGVRVTSLDFTTALTMVVTGTSAGVGAADNDITCTVGYVEYKPAG